ncbi:MAG: hypothetical protein IPO45_17500 [Saprospiraceae bacterium]|jgi:alpha-L-arabinofuranosidase|uniref:hypothetical protein n=1 Tax=Candidatus Brachybacter algidus TaxID=2982024 RepID=UPI001B4004AE|nr:hypothetical protein [Candidatus Brachybacter algidus]MBP7307586.1 hypothetical protein [Saprospiraceae bacterium]MBK6374203.1 hypothetical protein [Candidatus Brachybacter algidus]MBK6449990.1 hypothetical protein [Candidatus Brachybacter algidus]MBK7604135.1 hypothetical protein [Candidatus Brachybacter algidus]MBK8353864.1 hypothetical protein [Candidatus Brachybacter algidus]
MKQLLIILLAAISITACKKNETTQTTVNTTDSIKVEEAPVIAEQPKLIELADQDAVTYATEYDDVLNAIVLADAKNDKAEIMKLKAKITELDKKKDEMGAKLTGKDLDTYNGFLEKRMSTAQRIISKQE